MSQFGVNGRARRGTRANTYLRKRRRRRRRSRNSISTFTRLLLEKRKLADQVFFHVVPLWRVNVRILSTIQSVWRGGAFCAVGMFFFCFLFYVINVLQKRMVTPNVHYQDVSQGKSLSI